MKTTWAIIGLTVSLMAAVASSGCSNSGTAGATNTRAARERAKPPSAPLPSRQLTVVKRPSLASRVVAAHDTAAIIGWVNYQGTPPKPKTINFGPEKVCGSLHGDKPPLYETLVVNPNGTLKWALVTIRGSVPGTYPPPAQPVVVDQVGCVFTPHVVGAMVGQEVEFRNSDPVSHNIRGTPVRNLIFNNLFASKVSINNKFDKPEIGIPLKCDIHFWMSAYVHVMPHPFFAITGDEGSFVISGVPPGSYTLVSWHESFKPQTQMISLSPGEVKEIDVSFSGGG
jgi:plastocyanin